jgi:hypothetical protein
VNPPVVVAECRDAIGAIVVPSGDASAADNKAATDVKRIMQRPRRSRSAAASPHRVVAFRREVPAIFTFSPSSRSPS